MISRDIHVFVKTFKNYKWIHTHTHHMNDTAHEYYPNLRSKIKLLSIQYFLWLIYDKDNDNLITIIHNTCNKKYARSNIDTQFMFNIQEFPDFRHFF